MTAWQACAGNHGEWPARICDIAPRDIDVWPDREHPAGFDPHGVSTATIVRSLLETLARIGGTPRLQWLLAQREEVERCVGLPLDTGGIAAAAFADIGFTPAEGEMLYLLLRLPGAAAHALEQQTYGFKRFPFPEIELEDDPAREAA